MNPNPSRRWPAWIAAALAAYMLVACSFSQVRQLDEYKSWAAQGDDEAIVTHPADCRPGTRGCDQLRLIRGMACYRQAHRAIDPVSNYGCAIDELSQGLTMGRDAEEAQQSLLPYERALLESLRERRDLASSWDEAFDYNRRLQARAAEFADRHPGLPDGHYYGASAIVLEANRQQLQGAARDSVCSLLDQARQRVQRAAREPASLGANIEQLARQVARMIDEGCR